MNKFPLLFFAACALSHPLAAQSDSIAAIRANMGSVDFSGLPRLTFDLVNDVELAQLGFVFRLIHRASTDYDAGARTEWLVTGAYTCAYKDIQGNFVWLQPNGQEIVFKNPFNVPAQDGSRIRRIDGGDVVLIEDVAGNLWTYRQGFIATIDSPRLGKFTFQTDREAILSISKSNRGMSDILLNISYSESGEIQSLESRNRESCSLARDSRHRLVMITKTLRQNILLEYDNLLLTKWRSTDGTGNIYAWTVPPNIPERIDMRSPPIFLKQDASFIYEYDQVGGARIIRVKTPDNRLFSETRISRQGIRQRTDSAQTMEFPLNAPRAASPK